MGKASAKEIVLGDGFGDVAVKANGATIEVHADGSVAAHTAGDVDAYTDASVRVHPAGNVNEKPPTTTAAELKPGERMPDGTVYAGISPDTHQPMYTTPADAPPTMKWKAAMQYAAKLDAHDYRDWRVPTRAELNVLYENRDKGALKGAFNASGSGPARWYGSSTEDGYYSAWAQRFSDGYQGWYGKGVESSLRCVRG